MEQRSNVGIFFLILQSFFSGVEASRLWFPQFGGILVKSVSTLTQLFNSIPDWHTYKHISRRWLYQPCVLLDRMTIQIWSRVCDLRVSRSLAGSCIAISGMVCAVRCSRKHLSCVHIWTSHSEFPSQSVESKSSRLMELWGYFTLFYIWSVNPCVEQLA